MVKRLFFLVALGVLLTACNTGKAYRQLCDIESYISDRPDSALGVLRSIDTLSLRSKSAKAKYSLLHAMALDKNYIDTTDLCIISPAVRYYSNHGTAEDRMKAYYYLGRIYENARDYYSAMDALTTAYDISGESEDNNFKCLVCAELGSMYANNGNAVRDLYFCQMAKEYADRANNELNSWIMEGRIATCYANLMEWEKSDSLFADFLSRTILDTNRYASLKMWASHVAVRKSPPDAEKSINLYKEAVSLGKRPNVTNLIVLAYAYELLEQRAESDRIMSAVYSFLGNTKNSSVDLWSYRLHKLRGDYATALSEFESTIQAQDSLLVASLEESFDKVQKDYYIEKSNRISAEKSKQVIVTWVIVCAAIIVFVIILLLFLRKKRQWIQYLQDAESLRNDFARLLNDGNDKDLALSQLRSQYNNVFREQFKVLDDLCAAFWSPKKGNKKELIYTASTKAIELIKNDERLEEMIDKYLDGMMTKLRTDMPGLKDKDFKLIALYIIGFSGKTIASITGLSVGTVYTYRNRLKQEINNLDSPNKDTFLELLR